MRINLLHPTEMALQIVKDGIEYGQKADHIKEDIMNTMEIEEKTADKIIQDLLSRKVIFKQIVRDDMMGKVLFYTFERPLPPPIKKIGKMLLPAGYMTGQDVRQSTGIKTFAKSKVVEVSSPRTFEKRTIPANSIITTKKTLVRVIPDFVRTKFPGMKRTKHAEIKLTRTK